MAKAKSFYVCSECGYKTVKWMGKCDSCGEWGTFEEEVEVSPVATKLLKGSLNGSSNIQDKVVSFSKIEVEKNFRYKTSIEEFDRVLGGGLVKGEVVLITGNPGIGKSTLLLQTAKEYSEYGEVLYVSGEESPAQIKSRGDRLGIYSENITIMSETDIQSIYE